MKRSTGIQGSLGIIIIGCLLALGEVDGPVAAEPSRPNIVIILADDLGYGDVKCLNPDGKIKTPHLDRLAAAGMVFTDAHSPSSVCTPTRYGLLTGRYCWRSKLQSGVLGGLSPRLIEPGRQTIASLLQSRGYATACIGKWHLGMDWELRPNKRITELGIESREQVFNVDYTKPIRNGPAAVGFDHYFGISASLDMVPYAFIENNRVTGDPTEDRAFRMRSDNATRLTRKGPAVPGFEAADVLPALTKAALSFIEKRAKERDVPFFLYLPLTAPHTPIAPSKEWAEKSGLGTYADFVAQTDAAAGEIFASLERNKLSGNTLVVFTSDNGCSPEADFPDLLKRGHNPSFRFRGHKADIYDGGHRVPFIVRWPAIVKAGTTSDHLLCLTDLLRTCTDLAGTKVPEDAGEDSYSFLPALRGEKSDTLRGAIVHHSINGSFAIRQGPWKLCLCPGSGGWSAPRPGRDDVSKLPTAQLFNMVEDESEQKNLHEVHTDIVKRLSDLLSKYVADGRSTPGQPQKNAVAVDVWKAGRAAMTPPRKK